MGTVSNITGYLIAILGSSYFISFATGQDTCTLQTGSYCICEFDDGTKIDLNPIAKNNGKPRFNYALNGDYEYAYNPCYPFTDPDSDSGCVNVAACQRSKDLQFYFNIGDPASAKFSSNGNEISYTGSDNRKTDVALICDPGAHKPKYEALGETSPGSSEYQLKITSCAACQGGCIGSGKKVLSVGSILCILFVVLVFVYLVGGMLFNRYARGASGKEVIPNVSLWEEFPLLVKDGFVFVASCFKSDTAYESI